MRLSIGAFALSAVAVAVAALLAVTGPATGSVAATHPAVTSTASSGSGSAEAGGGRALAQARSSRMGPLQQTARAQHINLEIRTTEMLNGEEQPRYVPVGATAATLKNWQGHLTVTKGRPVVLTIINEDDGSAPLAPGYRQFDSVQGGTETVEGIPVSSISNEKIAHTFTMLGLNVNAAIPAAPKGSTDTIVLTFTPTQTGTFPWQCFAPCGIWSDGFGGAMDTPGWMKGTITVTS